MESVKCADRKKVRILYKHHFSTLAMKKKLARVEKWCLCNMPIQIYNSAFWHPDLVINICA